MSSGKENPKRTGTWEEGKETCYLHVSKALKLFCTLDFKAFSKNL